MRVSLVMAGVADMEFNSSCWWVLRGVPLHEARTAEPMETEYDGSQLSGKSMDGMGCGLGRDRDGLNTE